MTYDSSDPATIERELAETRARLDTHLEELTGRLSPGQLLDDGLNSLRRGQGAEFARNLGAELRDNSLPVALTGVGLVWLMATSALTWNRGNRPSRFTDDYRGPTRSAVDDIAARAQRAGDSLTCLADESQDTFRMRVAEARAQVLGLQREPAEKTAVFVDRVQQALDTAKQSVQEQLEQMRQTGREWGSAMVDQTRQAGETIGNAAEHGRESVTRAGNTIAETVNENPLLLGALGVAAGVLLAALLPVTEQEEALVAPVGGAIRRATDEVVDRGRRAAEAAAAAAYQGVLEEE